MSFYGPSFGNNYYQSWNSYAFAYAQSLSAGASGVVSGQNPAYTAEDFYLRYPGFRGLIEPALVGDFLAIANGIVKEGRWFESWRLGMGLLIAHYCTLFLQAQPAVTGGGSATSAQMAKAGQSAGLVASKSVGDLSISYDNSLANSIAADWGDFALTGYGKQFATLAGRLSPGIMVVR